MVVDTVYWRVVDTVYGVVWYGTHCGVVWCGVVWCGVSGTCSHGTSIEDKQEGRSLHRPSTMFLFILYFCDVMDSREFKYYVILRHVML